MSVDEEKPLDGQGKPTVGAKAAAPKPPAPPERPEATGATGVKDKGEMPDLDQFNFMSW